MWTKYIPRFTHGGWFGGIGRGDVWGNFWDQIAAALTASFNPGSDFVNVSGKTDYQENYEWKQHQASWKEYVNWKFQQELAKARACGADPLYVYNRNTRKLTLYMEKGGGGWKKLFTVNATDKLVGSMYKQTELYKMYHIFDFLDIVATYGENSEEFESYGPWLMQTDAWAGKGNNEVHGNGRDPDDSEPLASTKGCIRASNADMDYMHDIYDYYYPQDITNWNIIWTDDDWSGMPDEF